jgi:hypothetical protein
VKYEDEYQKLSLENQNDAKIYYNREMEGKNLEVLTRTKKSAGKKISSVMIGNKFTALKESMRKLLIQRITYKDTKRNIGNKGGQIVTSSISGKIRSVTDMLYKQLIKYNKLLEGKTSNRRVLYC